jgi:hypothetical protein
MLLAVNGSTGNHHIDFLTGMTGKMNAEARHVFVQ